MAERVLSDKQLQGADGLRTIACLMVVFHHLSQQLVFNPTIAAPEALRAVAEFFASSGSAGVSVFFVLSGFLLSTPFWRAWSQGQGFPDLRVYAARRAGRIMPGFYLNLFFFFVISLLFEPQASAILWRYFAGLTFTSGFHWLTFFPVEDNGPLWSIGFEVVSYVLMPLGMAGLFAFGGKKRSLRIGITWWVFVWLLVLAANQAIQQFVLVEDLGKGWQYGITGGGKFWAPRYNPIGFFGHFSLGILAAGVVCSWSRIESTLKRRRLFDGLSLLFFVLWLALLIGRTNQDQFSWNIQGQPYYFPLFPGLTAALLACLTQSGRMGQMFDNRFSQYTAKISFGLYLWHSAVLGRFNGAIGDTAEWLLLVAVTLVGSYLVAGLSWKYFEEPILRRAQRWKPGKKDPLLKPSGRFPLFVGLSAAALVFVPLVLTATIRPTAADLPTPAETYFAFRQNGPVNGLVFDAQGRAYVTKNGCEVYRILPDKTSRLIYTLPQEPATVRFSADRPKDDAITAPIPALFLLKSDNPWFWTVKLGPDGNLYIAASNRVVVLSPEGRELATWPYPFLGRFGVMDLTFDAAGNFYVSDGNLVFRQDRQTNQTSVYLDTNQGILGQAAGILFDSTGSKFFVCDFDNKTRSRSQILEFPVVGGQITGPARVIPAEGVLYAAESPSGDLVFSGSLTGTVYRWKADHTVETFHGPNLGPNTALAFGGPTASRELLYAACWNGTLSRIALPPGDAP